MATTGSCVPGQRKRPPNLQPGDWSKPPAVLVRAALALPRALNGMEEIISALLAAVEAKSPHTANHLVRVGGYAGHMAAALDLPEAQANHVARCGLLHDVGKLGIPEAILEKPGKLTPEEWGLILLHPGIGASVLRGCPSLSALQPAIAMHHERWDGRGYPYEAREWDIPLEARIISICDAYDTMTSERPYKLALPADLACGRLLEGAGSQFDPELVQIFVDEVLPGLTVDLLQVAERQG